MEVQHWLKVEFQKHWKLIYAHRGWCQQESVLVVWWLDVFFNKFHGEVGEVILLGFCVSYQAGEYTEPHCGERMWGLGLRR